MAHSHHRQKCPPKPSFCPALAEEVPTSCDSHHSRQGLVAPCCLTAMALVVVDRGARGGCGHAPIGRQLRLGRGWSGVQDGIQRNVPVQSNIRKPFPLSPSPSSSSHTTHLHCLPMQLHAVAVPETVLVPVEGIPWKLKKVNSFELCVGNN
jgi:hypothetical protein